MKAIQQYTHSKSKSWHALGLKNMQEPLLQQASMQYLC